MPQLSVLPHCHYSYNNNDYISDSSDDNDDNYVNSNDNNSNNVNISNSNVSTDNCYDV